MQKTYPGIHKDENGGMTATGDIIKRAWVFGVIPETETCEGWSFPQIQELYSKVAIAQDQYGFSVGDYPEEIRERHFRIYNAQQAHARNKGWDPDGLLAEEN